MNPTNLTRSRAPLGSVDIEDVEMPGPRSREAPTIPFERTTEATQSSACSVGRVKWDVEAGDLIDGKFRVVRELGRGAMGVVVLADDEALDRKVALKLVRTDLGAPGFRDRFLEEARAMARVNHANVVQIYASGEHESVPYFVMELVTGKTLEQWLEERDQPVEVSLAVRILVEMCVGVSAIHRADTLHRDIKPSNILLDSNLHPRIADLGVSTMYETARASRAERAEVVGTPAYMAPEVAFPMADQTTTPRVDVYSLACVAYELLTGQPPFTAEDAQQWFLKHATAPVVPPSTIRPDLPLAFDAVLLRALEKDPEARTPTIEAFRHELLLANGDLVEPVCILVAEDDDDFRELLKEHLRSEFPEAEVVCVPNGRAALQALAVRSVSIVILDLNMPDLDGFEVTRHLRAQENAKTIPIIVLTGSGGPAEWRKLASIGADRFLVKPVSLDDLTTSVRHSLRERSRSSELP
jgi:serine/threonine protein kinase